jgi:membrane protease YdiL (CAAX protease family)
MEPRDRLANYLFVALAAAAWVFVGSLVTSTYPHQTSSTTLVGALAIGLACGTTSVPLFWLAVFARHRRIAFRGDWGRAIRRGGWVGLAVAFLVALRLEDVLTLPIVVFVVTMIALAEIVLSAER